MDIEYIRKDKTYHKKIYIITTPYMIKNIKNNNILKIFYRCYLLCYAYCFYDDNDSHGEDGDDKKHIE